MEGYAKFLIKGMLGADPDIRYTQGGTCVATLRIVANTREKMGEEWREHASWYSITWFGKRAEGFCGKFGKTTYVTVHGRMRQESWEDKNSGEKRYAVKYIADDVYLDSFPKDFQAKGQSQERGNARDYQPRGEERPQGGNRGYRQDQDYRSAPPPAKQAPVVWNDAPDQDFAPTGASTDGPASPAADNDFLDDDQLPF